MESPFEIVRAATDEAPQQEARSRLGARKLPPSLANLDASAPAYQLDEELRAVLNAALVVGAPLLLTGEPGTGKTQVAFYLKWYFNAPLETFYVKSTSTVRDLLYDFDAVAYLRSANDPAPNAKKERKDFMNPGPLWKAYSRSRNDKEVSVVLIDEIDKAPRDFPNDLLLELDKHQIQNPFEPGQTISADPDRRPIIIVTSNAERRLPDAFLRRCISHRLELSKTVVRKAVEARWKSDFPRLTEEMLKKAIEQFFRLRELPLEKKPSTAELLVWLAILSAKGLEERSLDVSLSDLPAIWSLIKLPEDRERLPR
ncbi:MAG: MoxR family ATPase [Planctomycetes bacterium]|nr:MoxR family ATPase [Planctomycetota bacterium]